MKTADDDYSIIDREIFYHKVAAGIDVARAPGWCWLKAEDDPCETTDDFIARVKHEARGAGLTVVESSGTIITAA